MIKSENLNSFLTLGYFLDYSNNPYIPVVETNSSNYKESTEYELIQIGSKILLNVFSKSIGLNTKHLVPLSGGYDSRAILGALLKFTETTNIKTYTFGIPGSLDFELGRKLSKNLGIENFEVDLTKQKYSKNMLLSTIKRFNHQTFLFYHPDYDVIQEKFNDYIYWSGFLGGEAAGSHFKKWETNEMDDNYLKGIFLKKNQYVKSIYLANKPLNSLIPLIDGMNIKIENLSRYEKIDFFNRQTKYIAPHVCPSGFNIITPFSTKEWLSFILSIPHKFRQNTYLYEKILLNTFPDLFSFPTKNKYGLSLQDNEYKFIARRAYFKCLRLIGFSKTIKRKFYNYFDINSAIRDNIGIQKIIIDNINDLKARKIVNWLNLDKILKYHLSKRANYGDALQVLVSLEFILKSKEG